MLILPIGITILGGLLIRSTQLHLHKIDWWEHWITGGMGLVLALMIARMRYEFLIQWHWVLYGLGNILLILVRFIGIGKLEKGAQSWINIFGFHIQPSEFAKLVVIITLAALLHSNPANTLPAVFRVLAVASVPWFIVFTEPDLGSSLVFGAIVLGMLYWGNARISWLLLLVSPLVSAIIFNVYLPGWLAWTALLMVLAWRSLPWGFFGSIGAFIVSIASGKIGIILWQLLKTYQKDRLIVFLAPEKYPKDIGYQLLESMKAIGSGGIHGQGLFQGPQTQLDFVPEQHTDFIFSALGEELGLIGSVGLLLAFWLICWRLIVIAKSSKDNFGSLLAAGVLSMIIFQVIVNISMTVGLAPITGITLPWLSYGRSSLLVNFMAIGLVESVANYRQNKLPY